MAFSFSRRRFLWAAALGPGLWLRPRRAGASRWSRRTLAFEHTHTGESLSVTYYAEGRYRPSALARVNHLLRDFRSGESHPIDRRLLDLLWELRLKTGAGTPFQVISGYRSPGTNAMLRAQGRNVAKQSLHMEGKAIDVRLVGVPTAQLRDVALDLRRGGVGYYEDDDFVHVDVGRIRRW